MHEASLVQGLLEFVLEAYENYNAAGPERRAGAIREIVCGAGLLASFEERTLRDCFELFAEGTPAEGAKLTIRTDPLPCVCDNCGAKFTLEQRRFICPLCGSGNISFSGGHGLELRAINVDSEDKEND